MIYFVSNKDASEFCKCLGGGLVSLYEDQLMKSLSFYTLGLRAGLKHSNSKIWKDYNILDTLF